MAKKNLWDKVRAGARKLGSGWFSAQDNTPKSEEPRGQGRPAGGSVGKWPNSAWEQPAPPAPKPAAAPAAPPKPLETMAQASAEVFNVAKEAHAKTSGVWGPLAIDEYQKSVREAAQKCALKGEARVAAADAMLGLARGYIFSVQITGGEGNGEYRWRVGVKERLAKYGELPKSAQRQGAAWATKAHFAAMEVAVSAHKGSKLESLDWQGWQMHLEDCFEAGLFAARGIAVDFSDNLWAGVCARQMRWARNPDQGKWDSRRLARAGFELIGILAKRGYWPGVGNAQVDGSKLALMAMAQEELWVGHLKANIAKQKKDGSVAADFDMSPAIEKELANAHESCRKLGEAAASTPGGRAQILELAGKLRGSFATLENDAADGSHWAGMEKSAKALSASPWLVGIIAEAAKSNSEMMTMRNRAGETVGGLINAVLAETRAEEGGEAKTARSRLALKWMEEAVLGLLEASPDGASMLVPVVDFMKAAASDAIRVKAEQVEIARAMAPASEEEISGPSQARRL